MTEYVLLSFIISLLISAISIPVIIRVAQLKNLTDDPDQGRKTHSLATPTLGGVAIFAGLLVAFTSLYDLNNFTDLKFITPALVILFFAGIKDDVLVLDPTKKLAVQILCASIIVYFGNLRLTSLWGIMTIGEIPYFLGIALTIFLIVAMINAFNLIDGINGLAGSLGLIAAVYFGSWFAMNGFASLTVLSFSLAGALVGFLLFNYNRAKIFMGDTGSMAIGFIIAILAVRFVEANRVQLLTIPYPVVNAPAMAFAVLSVPLFDMIRVFGVRLLQKKSPFSADRNHIHHYFVDRGFSHARATGWLLGINLSCMIIAYPLDQIRSAWGILVLFLYLTVMSFFVCRYLKKTAPERLQNAAKVLPNTTR
jgi:UDP-N-acetylmuramyl pentapeptide phosphotransferase/UDP-N-acetylglucosamine-1-phosphate transferase